MREFTRWKGWRLSAVQIIAIIFLGGLPSFAAAKEQCFDYSDPVVSLEFGSRYKADSKNRSDIDEESDAEVTKALKTLDVFVQALSRQISKAETEENPEKQAAMSACVLNAVYAWAAADALSDMRTMNAKLAVPSRIGGIAIAYAESKNAASGMDAEKQTIENWLQGRARATMEFFDNEATKGASRNNLRAWASLAVGQIGIVTQQKDLVDWSVESNRTMIAGSADDGSLPLEMRRKQYALHYQLHALSPLVTSIAMLCDAGYGNGQADLTRLETIARFSIEGVKNPALVEKVAGAPQTVKAGLKSSVGSLAWLEPYAGLTGDQEVIAELAELRPLLNSKLGGDVTRIYGDRRITCGTDIIR